MAIQPFDHLTLFGMICSILLSVSRSSDAGAINSAPDASTETPDVSSETAPDSRWSIIDQEG